jgi:hypothetical protein
MKLYTVAGEVQPRGVRGVGCRPFCTSGTPSLPAVVGFCPILLADHVALVTID